MQCWLRLDKRRPPIISGRYEWRGLASRRVSRPVFQRTQTQNHYAQQSSTNNVLRTPTLLRRERIDTRSCSLAQPAPVVPPGRNDIDSQSRSPGQGLDGIRLAAHLPKCSARSAGHDKFWRQGVFLASGRCCTTKRRDAHANLFLLSPAIRLRHKLSASLSASSTVLSS